MGWYMVKSGLVDNPYVSQYRLTAHLLLAILIYGFMFWVALDLLFSSRQNTTAAESPQAFSDSSGLGNLAKISMGVLVLSVLTITTGGFVAGLKAGMSYNTFPLMAGQWVPDGILNLQPWYRNFFENVATVQFEHRFLAISTLLSVSLFWLYARRYTLSKILRFGFHGLLVVVVMQVILGISTLLLQVPIVLASAHQAGALVFFTMILLVVQQLHHPTNYQTTSRVGFKSVPASS